MTENQRKQIIINPRIMAAASDSRFLRDVLETIVTKVKKAVKK